MNPEESRKALEAAGVLDCHEEDVKHRLLYEDKVSILSAIQEHGKKALGNVTKGERELYNRDKRTVIGPDADFLRRVFLSDLPLPDSASLTYSGPEHIQLFISEKAYTENRAIVIDSYSPFEDRAKYQKPAAILADETVIYGFRFSATMQRRNTLRVLRMHGRIERKNQSKLPAIIKENWQGIWLPKTKSWHELGLPIDEMPTGTMASEIGPISVDGGDYLRFMLLEKAICSSRIMIATKERLITAMRDFYGQDGHNFGAFA